MPSHEFRDAVYAIVSMIPEGRVMTYGDIAGLAGNFADELGAHMRRVRLAD